jgi:hypothetical protein
MDPLGFALEHFDATGKWREDDQGAEINTLIDWSGKTIQTPMEFRAALLARSDQFIRTVTEKMMTYALGRGVDAPDGPTVRQIDRELAKSDNRWSTLILGIVQSAPFEMRRVPAQDGLTIAQK